MKKELYNKIFERMDELGCIRWSYKLHKSPILSDVIKCLHIADKYRPSKYYILKLCTPYLSEQHWIFNRPYLKDQSDELGEKLLELIK